MKWLQNNFSRAKAVMIAPEMSKAGLHLRRLGRNGDARRREDPKTGKWVGPAFYGLATASVGFQAGIAVSEVVTLVMTDKGMNSLLTPSFKMGGDASVAAGPVGAGAKGDIVADLVAFSRAEGRVRRCQPRRHRRQRRRRLQREVLRQEGAVRPTSWCGRTSTTRGPTSCAPQSLRAAKK